MRFLILGLVALSLSACGQPGKRPATTSAATTPQAAPQKVKISSAELLGQTGIWVRAKIGTPEFVRSDMQANLWQYKNAQCVLNVFLYTDGDAGENSGGDTGPARVLHFDARDPVGNNTDRNMCLSSLQD